MEEEEIPPPVAVDEVPEVPIEAEIEVEDDTAVGTADPEIIETDVVEESGVDGVIDGYVVFSVTTGYSLINISLISFFFKRVI